VITLLGFGAQLRALAKQKAAKQTTDFGSCRDLSGRRLRHVCYRKS